MEDAVFNKKSVSDIMKLKEDENTELEAVQVANPVHSVFDQLHSIIVTAAISTAEFHRRYRECLGNSQELEE